MAAGTIGERGTASGCWLVVPRLLLLVGKAACRCLMQLLVTCEKIEEKGEEEWAIRDGRGEREEERKGRLLPLGGGDSHRKEWKEREAAGGMGEGGEKMRRRWRRGEGRRQEREGRRRLAWG